MPTLTVLSQGIVSAWYLLDSCYNQKYDYIFVIIDESDRVVLVSDYPRIFRKASMSV
jgi:hypothetical protein